jgi:serine phosphatase RsbU (regulator of sigma subunit)
MSSSWIDSLRINPEDSWKQEYARLGGLYASWGAVLVIFLFPTVIFSELHVERDNNQYWLFFRLMPSFTVGLGYLLYKKLDWSHEVLLEIIAFSLFTSVAYRASCGDWIGYLVSFSTCFMASAILTILRPKILYINFVIIWAIHIIFYVVFCGGTFAEYWQDRATNFFPVVGLISFSLAIFRYHLLKNNFQQRLILKTANEELKEKSDLIAEQNEELKVQKEEILSQRDAIEDQNKVLETRNRDIMSSISYAKRIQSALLPNESELGRNFKDHFVYFKPKDLVSGDFYWVKEMPQKVILAVMDCTGHGVPGALMSMMGLAALNKVISQVHELKASVLLTALDFEMQSSMKSEDTGSFDGMDIGICIIDKEKQTLEFAGANQSLVIFDGNQSTLLKGNRLGIGGIKLQQKVFESKLWNITYGQRFYLCTDGLKDQFGGKDNKKYLNRRLISFLQNIQTHPMNQHGQLIDQELRAWTEDFKTEQVDDILIFGFEV